MVFFTCDGCGESVKKNQVEKHTFACKRSHAFSCMDCNKIFTGEEYKSHTKCISEDQKYAAKGFTPKENKGEMKQQAWVDNVRRAIQQANPKNQKLQEMLKRLEDYPNIPRKEAKFLNFLANSVKCRDRGLAKEVWVAISTAARAMAQEQVATAKSAQKEDNPKDAHKTTKATPKRKATNEDEEMPENEAKTPAKKAKKVDGTKEAIEDGTPQENGKEGGFRFKWASWIKKMLKRSPANEMKLKSLKKEVVGKYATLAEGLEVEVDEKEAGTIFRQKLGEMKGIKIDGKTVKYDNF